MDFRIIKHVTISVISIVCLLVFRCAMLSLNPYSDTRPISLAEIAAYPNNNERSFMENDFYHNLSMLNSSNFSLLSMKQIEQLASSLCIQGMTMDLDNRAMAFLFLPSSGHVLAMLIDDQDSEEYQNLDGISLPARLSYNHIAALHPEMNALRSRYEAFIDVFYRRLLESGISDFPAKWFEQNAQTWNGNVTLPGLSSLPRLDELDYSHTFALDIFLQDVEYLSWNIQRGPVIHSLSNGIVVAAESGWLGFPRKSAALSYIKGGISPKSGNGVIVYSPEEHRYYLYFHLYDLFVKKGDILLKGQAIGHGGNSGINARKKGGGDHLHLEIFDSKSGRFLRNTQIIALLKDSSKNKTAVSPK